MRINKLTFNFYRLLTCLMLVFLMVFVIFYGLDYIHFGFNNYAFNNVVVNQSEANIIFSDSLKSDLHTFWNDSPDVEYFACLSGDLDLIGEDMDFKYDNLVYNIDNSDDFTIGKSNYVSHALCNDFATIHKHPSVGCSTFLNSGDRLSAKKFFSRGGILFLIHCEYDKVEVYTSTNLYEGRVISLE